MVRNLIADALLRVGMETLGRAEHARLLRAAENPASAQHDALRRILRRLRHTELGRQNGFGRISEPNRFRCELPIQTFEDLRPHIERQAMTGACVVSAEPALMYAQTSGTTGRPKLIPVTADVVRQLKRAQRAMAFVQQKAFRAFTGRILAISGARCEDHLSDGTPVGSATGLIYETMPWALRSKYVLPPEVNAVRDYELKYRLIARMAAQSPDVTALATANPSSILRLLDQIRTDLPEIVTDMTSPGTELARGLPDDVKRRINERLPADLNRAAELRGWSGRTGDLDLAVLWPGLRSVMTWLGGSCQVAASRVAKLLPPNAQMIDAGYVASEVRGTIIIDAAHNLGLPLLTEVFFEFVPVDEWDTGGRRTRLLHEIEEGGEYHIVVTTAAGLVRYHMNDVVRVNGRIGRTPTFSFVRKGRGVTNITGEKLSEDQVNEAMRRSFDELGASATFHLMVADVESQRYRCYVEFEPGCRPDMRRFGAQLDRALKDLNIEYAAKRASGRLAGVEAFLLKPGSGASYQRHLVAKGQREAQLKVLTLQFAAELDFDLAAFCIGTDHHSSDHVTDSF